MSNRNVFAGLLLVIVLAGEVSAGERQVQVITGKVIDGETNQPVEGVTVWISGTDYSTTTDTWGEFELRPPVDSVFALRVRGGLYFDFITRALMPGMQSSYLEIRLHSLTYEEMWAGLEPQAEPDDMRVRPVQSVDELLTLVAGVQTNTTGEVYIRTTRSSEVSYFVDGVPGTD